MLKIPISGGPHTGKTTLLNALRTEYPEAYFVEEPAENVIAEQLKKFGEQEGIFPWNKYQKFAWLAMKESVRLEKNVPKDSGLVFLDRSLIDNIGYGKLFYMENHNYDNRRLVKAANYAFALFCEPVGIYTPTKIRRETPDQAENTHRHLAEAYDDSGLKVVHLPAISVPERIQLINKTLEQYGF